MIRRLVIAVALLLPVAVMGQQPWTLRQCIDYATDNNISVQQIRLNTQNQELTLNTARNNRLPSLNASLGESLSFGRSLSLEGAEGDLTEVYKSRTRSSASAGLSSNLNLYAGGRVKNDIAAKEYSLQASLYELESAREDVALNVTALYLNVLMYKEALNTAKNQVELSKARLRRSEQLFESGKSPQSDIFESKSVLANDELTLVRNENTLAQALLELAQALNLPDAKGFDVTEPQIGDGAFAAGRIENPDALYELSVGNRPNIQAARMYLNSSKKQLEVAKGSLYPQIGLSMGYSNGYYKTFNSARKNETFSEQLRNNGSENIGITASIPIFNRFATRNQISSAKISVMIQDLNIAKAEINLRKSIEQAHSNATAASQQYLAANKSLEAAREAFRYEEEKSLVGRSTIFEYNDAKTRVMRAESDMTQAKYQYIFYNKILDFYAGLPLDM